MNDTEVFSIISKEEIRQNEGIELIASENFPSLEVRSVQGSILTAKYAEGYPGHRYYGGCQNVDAIENLAIERAKKLFNVKFANVQPHSGSQANFAAYHALTHDGAKILSLQLDDGGHLTHGSPVSFSAKQYHFVHYPLGKDGRLDYQIIEEMINEENPDVFLAGYSAYPFNIDFKRMREIIDAHNLKSKVHTLFMVDMAHIAGIVAAGLCQNPCLYADIVTSTTHKTLRGPRGGLILCNDEALAKKVRSAVFPYAQGGPLEHVIGAKAVNFLEDLQPSFKTYIASVLENTKTCNDTLAALGASVSGTENHLFLLNVLASYNITGKEAEQRLGNVGITCNKNMIHGDEKSPSECSGIRIGFAALTSRGVTADGAKEIAEIIDSLLSNKISEGEAKARVHQITSLLKNVMTLTY